MNVSPVRQSMLALSPIIVAVAALLFDRDFMFALPLTALLALCAGVIAYLSDASERWPIYALIGGAVGWVGSVVILMNLKI